MSDTPTKVTILGSGTSTGIPIIGCNCEVCSSGTSYNQRFRASIAVSYEDGTQLVVDTGPEFRLQMLRAKIGRIDGVLYTHLHADHCHGFDDLRAFYFNSKSRVRCYLCRDFSDELKMRFAYAFRDTGYRGVTPEVELINIPDRGMADVAGKQVDTFRVPHGNITTSVFRFGKFAYATDFKKFGPEDIERWRGKLDVMVASGIHFGTHHTHSVIPETLELFDKLKVRRGVITHISHKIEHLRDSSRLPAGVEFAHDGMIIDLG